MDYTICRAFQPFNTFQAPSALPLHGTPGASCVPTTHTPQRTRRIAGTGWCTPDAVGFTCGLGMPARENGQI